ncbi:MAG: hypothetical protein ABW185_03135, partial [Sedimenticola sp.]
LMTSNCVILQLLIRLADTLFTNEIKHNTPQTSKEYSETCSKGHWSLLKLRRYEYMSYAATV